jgi:hypothetical protein
MTTFTADVTRRPAGQAGPRGVRPWRGRPPRAGLDGPSRPIRVEPVKIPQTEPRETPAPPREAPVPDREREPASP